MNASTILDGMSKAQRRAMRNLDSLVSEDEAVLDSLVRLGLVAEVSIPNLMDWNGPAFQEMRRLGMDCVANYFTPLGEEVRALLTETRQ